MKTWTGDHPPWTHQFENVFGFLGVGGEGLEGNKTRGEEEATQHEPSAPRGSRISSVTFVDQVRLRLTEQLPQPPLPARRVCKLHLFLQRYHSRHTLAAP